MLLEAGVMVFVVMLKELSPLIQRLVPQPICNVSSLSAAGGSTSLPMEIFLSPVVIFCELSRPIIILHFPLEMVYAA